jgi:hypothetical protein
MDGQPPGALVYDCEWCNNGGRRPAGFRRGKSTSASPIGHFFARMAELEAASIGAFRSLAAELAVHGAPPELSRAARLAARDEARHTRLTRALAVRYGAEPPRRLSSRKPPLPPRSLETVAAENAVEGCVRETFGALVAHIQAERAEDPAVRSAMREIARDETRHAALAWAMARWAEARLDEQARARVAKKRRREARRLARSTRSAVPPSLTRAAGVPTTAEARALALLWAEQIANSVA